MSSGHQESEGMVVVDTGRSLVRDTMTTPIVNAANIFLMGIFMFFDIPSPVKGSGDEQEGHGGH
jgi:hypothetical protein